jgi:pimeloyl-ACP methyl ester carboxylesterase
VKEGLLHLADGRDLGYAEYGAPDGQPVLYCHGFPTCRLELVPSESIIQALDAPPRVIAIDRPGFGLSTFQARRTFLGWSQDVAEAADLLGIGRFAMVGASGGCPYALACGAALGDRVLRIGIVVGAGPIQAPGMASSPIAGLPASQLARRIQFGLLALAFKAGWEDRVVAQAIATLGELDQRAMEQADVRDWFSRLLRESLVQGGRAAAYEAGLYLQPWGFAVEDVPTDTRLWYGGADKNVPASVGRWLADQLPRSHYTLWPEHGHFTWATTDEVGDVMAWLRKPPR